MNALMYLKLCTEIQLAKFLKDEKGEVNIVATVVLIGIAVALALAFREQIVRLLSDLFEAIFTTSKKATEEVTIP